MPRPLLLLVDDAPEIESIVQYLAPRAGQDVVSCPDVPSAWAYLQEAGAGSGSGLPDLIILDVHLPGASGLELCRRVRAAPALSGLPVALFGRWQRPDDIAAGIEAGIDFVLCKGHPIARPEAWQARVEEILTRARSGPGSLPLSWKESASLLSLTEGQTAALGQTLRHPVLLRLGPEVLGALTQRALRRVLRPGTEGLQTRVPGPEPGAAAGRDTLLSAASPGFDPEHASQGLPPEAVALFALAAALEVRCLVGEAASAPFRSALAAAVPLFSQLLADG